MDAVSAPTLLSVRDLDVGVVTGAGTRPILTGISFDLAEREILGVIGETGSGKTVLSRALVAWLNAPLQATAGHILYRGNDLLTMPAAQIRAVRGRQIAYIGSNPTSALDPTLPVGHQIVEKLRAIEPGVTAREARERVVALLAAVRIPAPAQRFHEHPSQFSGGMMQRALIVDALVGNPALLIADNVTQPLDVTVAAQILRLMRELRRDFATAIVFVSASLPMVSEIADEVVVLHAGRLVERQVPRQLVSTPQHAYTRALISMTPQIWSGEAESGPRAGANAAHDRAETPVLSVRDVARTYRVRNRNGLLSYSEVRAVRNVTFDVMNGENFGIVGESGCGKSTLSRLLSRLEAPDAGQILFQGRDIAAARGQSLLGLRRSLQLVLQDPYTSMPPRMTIGRIIEEGLLIHGLGGGGVARSARVRDAMGEVGLPAELHNQLPVGLSAGQRQRINIARAMVLEPRLLILDETLSSLDQTEQTRLLQLFERLQAQHGFTYIFISHDLAMVRRVCTRIAVMYLGEVVELAANRTLFFDPGHPYTRALLSAVPTIEMRPYRTEDCLLEGEPPSPINIPPGCSFASRCPHAFERCTAETPALLVRRPNVSGSRDQASCFLPQAA